MHAFHAAAHSPPIEQLWQVSHEVPPAAPSQGLGIGGLGQKPPVMAPPHDV